MAGNQSGVAERKELRHAGNTEESDLKEQQEADQGTDSNAAPAQATSGQKALERPSAEEIYRQVARNAKAELKRNNTSLAISGFTGGTFMGLSALGVGIVMGRLGTSPVAFLLSRLLYPLGFIVVILGRSQLFTENTLYPVALVLAEKRQLWNTLRLWAIVLPSNLFGAFAFAGLVALTPALSPDMAHAIAQLGTQAAHVPLTTVFWSAVVGGWIIATAAWMVSGSHSVTGSVLLIWLLTFVVGAGNFAHCIASSAEILTAVLTHQVTWGGYIRWLGPAVGGNICGGVLMVTLLEYGQAIYGTKIEDEVQSGGRPA